MVKISHYPSQSISDIQGTFPGHYVSKHCLEHIKSNESNQVSDVPTTLQQCQNIMSGHVIFETKILTYPGRSQDSQLMVERSQRLAQLRVEFLQSHRKLSQIVRVNDRLRHDKKPPLPCGIDNTVLGEKREIVSVPSFIIMSRQLA